MPVADGHASALLELDYVLTEQYWPDVEDMVFRHGRSFNALFPRLKEGEMKVESDGLNIKVTRHNADNTRGTKDPLADFGNTRTFAGSTWKVRYNEDDTSTNDFFRFHTSAKISDTELIRSESAGSVESGQLIDIADRVYSEMVDDYGEKLAKMRNCPTTGRLAVVNGTPVEDDELYVDGGAATADNTDGARFYVDNGSVAMFAPGMRLDIYTGASRTAGNVEVTSVNYEEKSVGVRFITGESSGNLASVANNDDIYLSGQYNAGMNSLEGWFTQPTSSDSFFGKNRLNYQYRWMLPHFTRRGASSATISRQHLNDACLTLSRFADMKHKVKVYGADDIVQKLRDQIDEITFSPQPVSGAGERNATMGASGVYFQHPAIGRVEIMSDPLAQPNRLRLISPETWRSCYYNHRGLRRIPAEMGNWYREASDTPGNGKSMFWRTDAYAFNCDICLFPQKNVEILNVTA